MNFYLYKILFISVFIWCSLSNGGEVLYRADAGPDRTICSECSVQIGTPGNSTYCYNWRPAEGLSDPKAPMPFASPQNTTIYTLTVTGENFSFKDVDAVKIEVVNRHKMTFEDVNVEQVAPPTDVFFLDECLWGEVGLVDIEVTFNACLCNEEWRPVLTSLKGNYYNVSRLLEDVQEVTGPNGNTNSLNYCNQIQQLQLHYNDIQCPNSTPATELWYSLDAVRAHENIHAAHVEPALDNISMDLANNIFTKIAIPNSPGVDQQTALDIISGSSLFQQELDNGYSLWVNEFKRLSDPDHFGPTQAAEEAIVGPLIESICLYAEQNLWPECLNCP